MRWELQHIVHDSYVYNCIYIIYIWRFPKIGVPPVIIHFNGFSNHKTRILRVAPFMETSILVYIYHMKFLYTPFTPKIGSVHLHKW